MKICKVKQHYIDFGESSLEQFISEYRATPLRSLRKALVESVEMQTNLEWLKARTGHITASNASKFLSAGRTKSEPFGDTAKGVINKYLDEIADPCFDDMESKTETYFMKQGLIFEDRAVELFEKEVGKKVNREVGFVSEEINGIKFGCSPDGLIYDKEGNIEAIIEIKSRTGAEFRAERNKLGKKETAEQMQMQMFITNCPRAYLVIYDIANDKIQYITWTRGFGFKRKLLDQIELANNYIEVQNELDGYTNLKDHLVIDNEYQE